MVRDETPLTLAGRTMGAGLVAPVLLLPALREGGLAPLAVAALVAVVVGVPAAQAEWRTGPSDRPAVGALLTGTAEAAGLLLVAVVAAPLVREAGLAGHALAVAGWAAATVLGRRPSLAWRLALGLVAVAVVRAVTTAAFAPVGTVLAPQWGEPSRWLGPALAAGLAAAAAGTGQWTTGARRLPGHDETPWAVAGGATVFGVALAVQSAARFETTLGESLADPGIDVSIALGAFLAAAAVLGRPAFADPPRRIGMAAVFGAVATMWLAGPAHDAVPLVSTGIVPGLAATLLLLAAFGSRATTALPLALGAGVVVACGAIAASSPALPRGIGGGAAAGLLLSVAFWLVATRVVGATRGTS